MNSIEEPLFRTIFEQTPISTQIFAPNGTTILVNKAWEDLWNVPAKKVVNVYNILNDEQLVESGIMPEIKKAFKGKSVSLPMIKYVPSKTVKVKDAVPFKWLGAKMYPIRNKKGEITNIVLQHEDVTQRVESEEMELRLASIVESSSDAIVSKTLEGSIISWNKSAEKLFGYTAGEAIGRHITLIIPRDRRSEEGEIIGKIRKGERIEHFETIRKRKDGTEVAVSLSISPVTNSKGEIIGASKIARDITEQKKAEKALQESEERLRIALSAGDIGVWDWDIINKKLTWTEQVYKIHGVASDVPLQFETFAKLIHPDDSELVHEAITKSLQGKAPFSLDFRIVTPNGETRWVSTSAIISFDQHKKATRMLGATTDISERKQLEQDKNDFLSMASHELKTPLTSMKIFIDLLESQTKDVVQEKPKYFLSRIKDQADRLTELTSDLLDVSRIDTGKLRLQKEAFRLDELIDDTVDSIRHSTSLHEIILKKSGHAMVYADRYRLYQVVINLLTNAIKYSPKGKKITVSIKKSRSDVVVSVEDFGIGIKKDQLDKIFERLYQVTDPEEKTYPGLGLGLYISKEIILRHNGKIWAESKGKGKGSTFFFSLPLQTVH